MPKIFFVSLEKAEKNLITASIEAGASAIILPKGNAEQVRKLGKICLISEDGDLIPEKDVVFVRITKKEDEAKVVALKGSIPAIIQNEDWTIIPLENLISKTSNLIQTVHNAKEARLALTTMERGADGVCLVNPSVNDILDVGKVVQESGLEHIPLVKAIIESITPVSMSDRCAIDTTSLLPPGTGLLIGDSAKAMFLVHNENVESPYCASRPFRVNAGAVHAYIRLPNNKTKYLCEISSGDDVLAVDTKGNGSIVSVGRNKIERRPMLLVRAIYEKTPISLVLQNAETIRLTSPEGKPLSVTSLKKGDAVLVHIGSSSGRHFGQEIAETIVEK
jgi:3-dehydroquinate synthase II